MAEEKGKTVDTKQEAGAGQNENEEVVNENTETTEGKEPEKEAGTEERKLEEMGQKLAAMNDKYLRLSAEFDNYRKRTLKEKLELTKSAGEEILSKILPVVDNFERALASMEKSDDVAALRQGVELIYNSFKDFLSQNGVKEIECKHTEFNTDEQEAVTKIPAPTEDLKGKVIDCVQKGYTLNGKVMRFAKVVVGE